MAAGQIFKYFIKVGKQYFGTNSKKVAEELAKGGKRVPKNKVPEGVTVKKAPTIPNPRTSKGTFTRPQPPAARPKTTSPARPSAPKSTSPARPKTQTTSPARPKPKTKAPAKPATPSSSRYTGGRGRKKAPLMPKNMVRERPNMPPPPKTSRPALLRDSARPEAPEVGPLSPVVKPNNKSGEMPKKKKPVVKPNNKSGESPKRKKESTKKTAPKGPMSLREYLNAQIKKRGSSVTKEKKGAEKYSSIAAAKRAGSLYYKNSKTGKIMAAVYKEDLKR